MMKSGAMVMGLVTRQNW
jgi:hypothetical protein